MYSLQFSFSQFSFIYWCFEVLLVFTCFAIKIIAYDRGINFFNWGLNWNVMIRLSYMHVKEFRTIIIEKKTYKTNKIRGRKVLRYYIYG